MAFQLKPLAELSKETTIIKISGIPEISEDSPIVVAFKQATEYEAMERDDFLAQPVELEIKDGMYANERRRPRTFARRRAFEVYLTMTACDILNENGKPLFNFAEMDGVKKFAGSYEAFLKKWGKLPLPVADAIHEKCIEVNPDWSFFASLRNNADEEDAEGN